MQMSPDSGKPNGKIQYRIEPTHGLFIFVVALLLIKLFVVSEREIVPERDDSIGYVRFSVDYFSSLFSGAASHPPGASLMIAGARLLGLPYRIFLEIILAIAALLLFRPLIASASIGLPSAAIGCTILLFHPVLLLEMDRAMADPVGFLCWLIGAAGLVGLVSAPRKTFSWWNLSLSIAAFGLMGITRSGESIVVLAVMVSVALLVTLMFWTDEAWRSRRAVIVCACATLANISATQLLSAVHFANRGYWGSTEVESREWWMLYSTLLSLPVQRADRHALIDRPTLELAGELSPLLRSMQVCWEAHEKDWYPKTPSGAFPNFIVQWAFTGCASGEDSFDKISALRGISTDIVKNAGERGIVLEPPLFGIVPRSAVTWGPELVSSFGRVARYIITIPESTRVNYNSWERLGPDIEHLLDRGLLRRGALVARGINPEALLYQSVVRRVYSALSWSIVPVAIILAGIAASATLSHRATFSTADRILLMFFILIFLEAFVRFFFYSIVDWIGWKIPARYIIGARVMPVVGVSIVLTAWGMPRLRALSRRLLTLRWIGSSAAGAR